MLIVERIVGDLPFLTSRSNALRYSLPASGGEFADDALRTRFRDIVDSRSLPPEAAQVTITRNADGIVVRATYEELVPLPGTEWHLVFQPHAERR